MIRLGELLVGLGALNAEQRDTVLERQSTLGRPFGALAEELYGVDPAAVDHALATQYASVAPRLDPRMIEPNDEVLVIISRRQAWQFGLIPVRRANNEVLFVSSHEALARAMRFVGWRVTEPVSFALCEHGMLVSGLEMHYPIDGMDAGMLDKVLSFSDAA